MVAIDTAELFERIGHLAGIAPGVAGVALANSDINYFRTTTIPNKITVVENNFADAPEYRSLIDGLYGALSSYQSVHGQFASQMRSIMQNLIVKTVNDDRPLTTGTVQEAMTELVRQMVAGSVTVNSSVITIGAQTAQGSPVGNPIIAVSSKGPDGNTLEYLFDETIKFTCTADQNSALALKNNETLQITSPAAVQDALSNLWPGGSGVSLNISASDATSDVAKGNLLVNSDFETFTTANIPDDWSILVGAAGTDVIMGSSPYTGSHDLQLASATSAGATLASVAQTFSLAQPNGSPTIIKRSTVYAVNFVCKVSAVPAAGVLQVDLVDGSNANIADDAGTANRVQVTLSGETTSYAVHTAFFRTPTNLPATVKIRVSLSTGLDSGKQVHVDHLCLTPAVQVYSPNGPWAAVFSMSTAMLLNDTWRMHITNSWGAVQQVFERTFGMRAMNLKLPSSGSPSIADSVVA